MSNKTTKRTLLFTLALFVSVSVITVSCNNEGDVKTESTVTDTTPVSTPAQDTVKMDTQKTRPVVKPN